MNHSSTHADSGNALDDFSKCHVGITQQLQALSELPALAAAATRARQLAIDTLAFMPEVVLKHHAEEEQELFPAVLASATPGAERAAVQSMVQGLARQHRRIEALWAAIEPAVQAAAKGQDVALDAGVLAELVEQYLGHAAYEEREFLPLCHAILGRNNNHLAALGISLHMRRVMPALLERYGHRI
jgi:hemerythrin-like domain-containing protein